MKAIILLLVFFLFTIQLYSQDYLNVEYSGSAYKHALVSEVSEITFNSAGTEMTITKTDASSTTDAVSTIVEMSFDDSPQGSPVPVELISFTATSIASTLRQSSVQRSSASNSVTIQLNWTTATEVNNYGFEVQCSSVIPGLTRNLQEWETIGFVEGHGNSNSPKEYNFVDTDASTQLSNPLNYRLKQIDTDGSFEYSETITVELGLPTEYSLKQNYPNPFNPSTIITYQIPKEGFVTLKVYDVLGREVATLVNENKQAGKYSLEFSSKQLSSGTYFYRLTSGEFTEIIKMILLR